MDTLEEIKKIKALLDEGAITTEEFNELKKKYENEFAEGVVQDERVHEIVQE